MKIKRTAKAGRVLVEMNRGDEALLDQAAKPGRKPGPTAEWKRILVPVDFSPSSQEALELATSLAAPFDAEITVLHVVIPFCAYDPYCLSVPENLEPDMVLLAEKELGKLVREALPPDTASRTVVRTGRPADEIIRVAGELGTDLIIIPTHGHTGLKHAVFGTTAEHVVRHAPCHVLVVRVPDQKKGRRTANN